jgi:hypothetical protein
MHVDPYLAQSGRSSHSADARSHNGKREFLFVHLLRFLLNRESYLMPK